MTVSVVIPCFNDGETIGFQLEAVARQRWSGDWEVVISDNGSVDNTLAIVEEFKERLPNLRVVDSSDRRGPGHARNVGAKEAKGDTILFCDADDEVASDWMEMMTRALSEHGLVACRLDIEKLNEPWVKESWVNGQEDDLNRFHGSAFLPFAGSGTIGVRRTVHEAVGGFDESLITHEDADYCWRIQLRGHQLYFVRDTCLYYRFPTSLRRMYTQERLFGQSSVLMYKRYKSVGLRKPSRPLRGGVAAWVRLFLRLSQVHYKVGRAKWVRALGRLVGHLQGSIRYRTLALY